MLWEILVYFDFQNNKIFTKYRTFPLAVFT